MVSTRGGTIREEKMKPFRQTVLTDPQAIAYFVERQSTPITEERVEALKTECKPFLRCFNFGK